MTLQLKQMEVQLEEEYEDKQKALREKRELESKLSTLSDQVRGDPTVASSTGPGLGSRGQHTGEDSTGDGAVLCITSCIVGLVWASSSPRPFSLGSTILLYPGEHPRSFWKVCG